MESVIEGLVRIGLSKKEARVYLAILQFGKTGANTIAKKTHIPRASVYAILEQLKEKGLVTSFTEKGNRRYRAEHPEYIERLLDNEQQEIVAKREMFKTIFPRLKLFHNTKSKKPQIRYFEGVDGLKRMQKEYESFTEDIIQIVGYDTFLLLQDPEATASHRKSIEKTERRIRSILVTDRNLDLTKFGKDCRLISPSLISVGGEMTVCGDRLVLFSYSSAIIAIEIYSPAIAQTAKSTLELAWRQVGELGKHV